MINRILLSLILMSFSAPTLAGLFSSPWEEDECPEKNSLAWCVIKAGSVAPGKRYQIKDVVLPSDQYEALNSYGEKKRTELAVVTGIGVAAGMSMYGMTASGAASYLLNDTGFKSMIGLGLLESFAFNGVEMRASRLIVWLPADKSASDAQIEFANLYLTAIKEVVGFESLEFQQYGTFKPTFAKADPIEVMKASGGPCGDMFCSITTPSSSFKLRHALAGDRDMERLTPPRFISDSPAYQSEQYDKDFPLGYFTANADCIPTYPSDMCASLQYHRLTTDQLLALSSKLPPYTYIFIGIDKTNKESFPVILHQGKILFFAKKK